MDNKIILSVLIVALIGIVAATYQINPGQEILNPLASVETEQTPVTEVLTAPEESQQQAKAQADEQAKQQAQAQAQAQQAKDEANAQAQAQAQAQQGQSSSSQAGSASQSGIINAENPVTVTATGNGGSSGDSNPSSSNGGGSGDGQSNGGSSSGDSNPSSSPNGGGSGDGQPNGGGSGESNPGTTPDSNTPSSTVDDGTWSEIDSIIQKAQSSFSFGITADKSSCSVTNDGLYKVDVYKSEDRSFVGTLFVNINKQSNDYGNWYIIDANGDPKGPDVGDH